MPKVKNTKTELKAQKDALVRFQKFLPMLQLKKQQLQAEIVHIRQKIDVLERKIRVAESAMEPWVSLLADASVGIPVVLDGIQTSTRNIAGLTVPVFDAIQTHRPETDLFGTPPWVDDAAIACETLLRHKAEITILKREWELIDAELHTTTQRVNLFEKVKIPECKENIRVIRIHIGDEQTSAVARGKIAKGRGNKQDDETSEEVVA